MKLTFSFLLLIVCGAGLFCGYVADSTATPDAAQPLYDLYLSRDYFALEKQLGSLDIRGPRRGFFEGQLDAAFLHDDQAKEQLRRFLASPGMEADWRKEAWDTLAVVELRGGYYDAAADAFSSELAEPSARLSTAARETLEQNLGTMRALHGVPPQSQSGHAGASVVDITWGKHGYVQGGYLYMDYRVNGLTETTKLDTGAGFSVASESFARRHKLHLLPGQFNVGTGVSTGIASQLGVADQVEFGGMRFEHVLFSVFKDKDLASVDDSSTIGLPLILPLGHLRVSFGEGRMEIGLPSGSAEGRAPERNLACFDYALCARLHYEGSNLFFELDTGTDQTSLYTIFVRRFPQALCGSVSKEIKVAGIGGQHSTLRRVIPQLEFGVDDRSVLLHGIQVEDQPATMPHVFGMVGGDLLAGGYELDFHQMRFSVVGVQQTTSTVSTPP